MADLKKFLITVIAVYLASTLFSWMTCGLYSTWIIPGTEAVKGLIYGAIVWAVATLLKPESFLFSMTTASIDIFY